MQEQLANYIYVIISSLFKLQKKITFIKSKTWEIAFMWFEKWKRTLMWFEAWNIYQKDLHFPEFDILPSGEKTFLKEKRRREAGPWDDMEVEPSGKVFNWILYILKSCGI